MSAKRKTSKYWREKRIKIICGGRTVVDLSVEELDALTATYQAGGLVLTLIGGLQVLSLEDAGK